MYRTSIRTAFCFAAAGLVLALLGPLAACAQEKEEKEKPVPPQTLIKRLEAGNQRFVTGKMLPRDHPADVRRTAAGQTPFAVVVSCVDSRVPPELVFDQGIGDLFIARIAGNFVDAEIIGSLEFTTLVSTARLVVVLGHTACGAIEGACNNVQQDSLTQTLSHLMPAVLAQEEPRRCTDAGFVDAIAEENVRRTVTAILDRSRGIRKLVEKGELAVVGAMYDVATGKVRFLP